MQSPLPTEWTKDWQNCKWPNSESEDKTKRSRQSTWTDLMTKCISLARRGQVFSHWDSTTFVKAVVFRLQIVARCWESRAVNFICWQACTHARRLKIWPRFKASISREQQGSRRTDPKMNERKRRQCRQSSVPSCNRRRRRSSYTAVLFPHSPFIACNALRLDSAHILLRHRSADFSQIDALH
jgi:hypothetical protein